MVTELWQTTSKLAPHPSMAEEASNPDKDIISCVHTPVLRQVQTLSMSYAHSVYSNSIVPPTRLCVCVTYKVWTWEQKMSTPCRNLKHCVDLHTSTQCFHEWDILNFLKK